MNDLQQRIGNALAGWSGRMNGEALVLTPGEIAVYLEPFHTRVTVWPDNTVSIRIHPETEPVPILHSLLCALSRGGGANRTSQTDRPRPAHCARGGGWEVSDVNLYDTGRIIAAIDPSEVTALQALGTLLAERTEGAE